MVQKWDEIIREKERASLESFEIDLELRPGEYGTILAPPMVPYRLTCFI